MTLNKYELFLKVAEIGNITKAAETLHYTQAGVSHAIAALEKETGFSLFIRSNSGVELTDNGKRLLPSIQALVNEQAKVAQAIHNINHIVAGTLRIGTFTSVSVNWIPHIIKCFSDKYPDVKFELLSGDYNEISEWIHNGKIDCGFLTTPVSDDLFFQTLYYDQMFVVLPSAHSLASRKQLTFSDIKDEPFILPMKGSDQDIRNLLDKNIKNLKVEYILNDDYSVISLASHGFGITIMPDMILKNFKTDAVFLSLYPKQYRKVGIASMPMNQVSILTKTFLQFISDFANFDAVSTQNQYPL